ncbi:MAG: sugar nucleotide-binding protein [Candidatus Staskawiczbacteria bacterium]|nr:sugar nucleotide-binding protein [Candidatus Staskawiczbacteria bacterium]
MKDAILVVGADSNIGASLYHSLNNKGISVVGTSRRKVDSSKIYLDLLDNIESWEIPEKIHGAVICAGITKIAECETFPELSYETNVTATTKFIQRLLDRKIFVVYLSSDLVVDATMSQKQYCIQKSLIEQNLMNIREACILRLSKVLNKNFDLFLGWRSELIQDMPIYPFKDKYFSPISMSYCIEAISKALVEKVSGIHEIRSNRILSYEEAAFFLASHLGADLSLINPTSAFKPSDELVRLSNISSVGGPVNTLGLSAPDSFEIILQASGL